MGVQHIDGMLAGVWWCVEGGVVDHPRALQSPCARGARCDGRGLHRGQGMWTARPLKLADFDRTQLWERRRSHLGCGVRCQPP